MIKDIAELLIRIREYEESKILLFKDENPYFNHPTIIGDIYEGLTHKLLSYAIPNNIDLRIVDGHIRNKNNNLSKQIDCMIVIGEGDLIPNTKHFIYPLNQVIAVIEVKKNLYASDLFEAYNNLNSIVELLNTDEGDLTHPIVNMLDIAFRSIVGTSLPDKYELLTKPYEIQSIYNVLLLEAKLPVRIILGYTGFSNEKGLRDSFMSMIEENSLENTSTPNKIFSPLRFPNQIICRSCSVIKTNGLPYANKISGENFWDICVTTSYNPLLIILELIFTRLTFLFGFDPNLFGDDLDIEIFNKLLSGKAIIKDNISGWIYYYHDVDNSKLLNHPHLTSWKPVILNEDEFNVLGMLCKYLEIDLDDESFNTYISDNSIDKQALISNLINTGLVGLNGNKIELLTDECGLAVIPGPPPRFVAGENSTGRLTRWLLKHS